ncbi:MAG TPA: DUF1844 domain-containing protein [bacterium]|nr:DUF1844 domain-containing protein [bacterium]
MPEHTSPPPDGSADDASKQAASPEAVPLAALSASDLLTWVLSLLAAKAWEGMGLVPSPLTSKAEKNMDEARLAIDAYAAVFEVVRARIEEHPRREMENLLTTLRLNFVEKSAG